MKLFRKIARYSPPWFTCLMFNCWPPFIGAGITVNKISPNYQYVRVHLHYRWHNKNYVGTQFGGSIYAMTDPFYMWMVMVQLGHDYNVWDKAASIDFVSPGKSRLMADFQIDDALIEQIRQHTAQGDKYLFDLPVTVYDEHNTVVANVIKTIYVRKKKAPR